MCTCSDLLNPLCKTSNFESHNFLKLHFANIVKCLFCWLWIFPLIKRSWYLYFIWDKLENSIVLRNFLVRVWDLLMKRFCYLYAWPYTLYERRTSFSKWLAPWKLIRIIHFSTGFAVSVSYFFLCYGLPSS